MMKWNRETGEFGVYIKRVPEIDEYNDQSAKQNVKETAKESAQCQTKPASETVRLDKEEDKGKPCSPTDIVQIVSNARETVMNC